MSGGAKVAVGVGVSLAVAGAFYYVYRRRQSMLVAAAVAPPAPLGVTSLYGANGVNAANGTVIPAISSVIGQSLPSLVAAQQQAAIVVTSPTVETRTGAGHF